MLSILIPTFNYDIVSLVLEVRKQILEAKIDFEIIVLDDGSKSLLNKKNSSLNKFEHCKFEALKNNIGRSAIRNLLAQKAQYENLLFIDAGTLPKSNDYIKNYLKYLNKNIVIGGMTHKAVAPKKPFKLRWLYTKKRESINNNKVFCSSNFLIKKSVFSKHPFDESLKKYGCEDVVFFNNLLSNNIKILQIPNPVIHDCEDSANTFISKSEESIENLLYLLETKKLPIESYKLSIIYKKIEKLKLKKTIAICYKIFKPVLILNFNSSYPSLIFYDFYKLGYLCTLKK
ncbi:glycosyltransferase family 2 protein [Pseudotamlana agarivorans]|uniref:glycosyltransferase family 2 protein n=1 Tax=Pseudotamlana agarivorans TaxID=481183 RepID=UPI00082E2B70|nr:glycosyltransferase family A protein [Tamlana agarivorans]